MSQDFIDDTIYEQGGDVAVAEVGDSDEVSGDNYGELQDRMAGDAEDSPWFSPSMGAVVDSEGNAILDKNGQPFKSEEAYKAAQVATAKPETKPAQSEKPMSKSFESLIAPDGNFTPERLAELSKAGGEYKYQDELVPKIEQGQAIEQVAQPEQELTPIQKAAERRQTIESFLVNPINEIRDAMLQQGAPEDIVNQILSPILQRHSQLVNSDYEAQQQQAMQEMIDAKADPVVNAAKEKELVANSNANIEKLARAYYPNGGADALFSLINGHNEIGADGKETFVRGPSAEVVDLVAAIAGDGKAFKTQQERDKHYMDTFRKITADPAKARSLVNVAHFYWLGKKAIDASKTSFERGKQSAIKTEQRINRTIKTPPASFSAPSTDDDEGSVFKNAIFRAGR